MEEIKFRAYIKNKKHMVKIPRYAINSFYGWNSKNVIIMQYAGLKDKNGIGLTELYEGDIISEDGILKGNIYEDDKRETDIVVPQLGTKDWETAYKKIVDRGYDYSK